MGNKSYSLAQGRIEYIDIARGIGIILIILGHNPVPPICHDWIFSFHVPLFFIIAGYFYKRRSLKETAIKGIRQLIVPFYITNIICSFFCRDISSDEIQSRIFDCIFVFREGQNMGLWFLLALFWAKVIFCLLEKLGIIICGIISFLLFSVTFRLAIIYDVTFLPFRVYLGMTAPIFLYIGYMFNRFNVFSLEIKNNYLGLIIVIILLGSLVPIEYYLFNYPLFEFNLVTSSMMSFTIILLCKYFSSLKFTIFRRPIMVIKWFGNVSLMILCIHAIESTCQTEYYMFPYMTACAVGPCKTMVIAIITWIILKSSIISQVYGYNRN